jgi:hypothetical protein
MSAEFEQKVGQDSIGAFVINVFSQQPKEKGMVRLDVSGVDTVQDLHDMFKEILIRAMILNYSDANGKVDINSISLNQFKALHDHFLSFGVNLYLKITHFKDYPNGTRIVLNEQNIYPYDPEALEKSTESDLIHYFYCMQKDDKVYEVRFEM